MKQLGLEPSCGRTVKSVISKSLSPQVCCKFSSIGKKNRGTTKIIQRYSLWSGIDRYGRKIAYILCEHISVVACWCDSDFSIFVVFSFQLRI